MVIRSGISSRGSVVATIKETLGKPTGVAAGLGVFGITLCFSVGNAVGTGLGLSLVLGGNPVIWTIACSILVVAILFTRSAYKVYEKLVLAIVDLLASALLVQGVCTNPDRMGGSQGAVCAQLRVGDGLIL